MRGLQAVPRIASGHGTRNCASWLSQKQDAVCQLLVVSGEGSPLLTVCGSSQERKPSGFVRPFRALVSGVSVLPREAGGKQSVTVP